MYPIVCNSKSGIESSPDSWIYSGNMEFSTFDRENDISPDFHCAQKFSSGWWMSDCFHMNLNGPYQPTEAVSGYGVGIIWAGWQGFEKSLKQTTMSIRSLD